MNREVTIKQLKNYMDTLDILDSHEHFITESMHLQKNYNFFHWFMPYIQFDLVSAGMPKEWLWTPPESEEQVKEYWSVIKPLWQYVKHGSYALPMKMALKEFYGFEDITDDNYLEIGKKMNDTKYQGYYKSIIQDKCKIKFLLNQISQNNIEEHDYMYGAYSVANNINYEVVLDFIENYPSSCITDYTQYIQNMIRAAKKEGAILVKFDASSFMELPDYEAAKEQYIKISKDKDYKEYNKILYYVSDQALKIVQEVDLVAAVHTGVWGDINYKNPELLFKVVEKYPDIVFDIYHMGMPYVRECGFLGKNYANVYLNLCWSHIVSENMAVSGINEWLDYVPVNKIFGFGADFCSNPENIWAHLEIAKKNIAKALAKRVSEERMSLEDAKFVCKLWLYDNPKRVYQLNI